jgi:hypothetical protein
MRKKIALKGSMESSRFESSWKSTMEFEQGEFMSNGCKASNMLIVFENAKVGQKGQEP